MSGVHINSLFRQRGVFIAVGKICIAALCGVLLLSGCQRAVSVIFDLPAKSRSESAAPAVLSNQPIVTVQQDTLRPRIEEILVADSVQKLLPKDHAGNIDWMAALREGMIKPKDSITGEVVQGNAKSTFQFGFDFYFEGPAPMFDAYFPHSAHTEWVNCQTCHGSIFKYRDTEMQMADILAGNYCGECHGKVSFPPVTGCERCHVDMPQAPNRAQPLLLGTIRMTRVERADSMAQVLPTDSSATPSAPAEVLITEEALPPAVFPHWVHRIRFTCKACHNDLFEPKAGANEITMTDISNGDACGSCHNGSVAFDAGFGTCQRCHVPEEAEAP